MEVSEIEGVISVKADLDKKQAIITFQPPATEEKIKTMLAEINYPAAI
jgi:copper chaperone CopZ